MAEETKVQGWSDVQINPEMSVSMIIGFLNVLNQRLVTVENLITVPGEDGKSISLTDYYARQAEAEAAAKANETSQPETKE